MRETICTFLTEVVTPTEDAAVLEGLAEGVGEGEGEAEGDLVAIGCSGVCSVGIVGVDVGTGLADGDGEAELVAGAVGTTAGGAPAPPPPKLTPLEPLEPPDGGLGALGTIGISTGELGAAEGAADGVGSPETPSEVSVLISSDAREVDPEELTLVSACTRNIAAAPSSNPVISIEDSVGATEILFPLLLSVMTYEDTGEPPFSSPARAVHVTVADPIPGTAVGLSTAFGNVVGVATRELDDHAPASES